MNAKRALSRARAPDEVAAEQRAWSVVRSAYREASPTISRRFRWQFAFLPVLVAAAGALALSPAGATIARWVKNTLGVPHAANALFSLPAPGRVLVSGRDGTWVIAADGSARRLARWSEASWSPRGLYIAARRGDRLAALNPHGTVMWELARPAVSAPRWYPPSGYRIAYLSRGSLHVVAGDGTGDHVLARGVAAVAPAWRPGHATGPYQLAYKTDSGRLIVRDAGSGRVAWTAPLHGPAELSWSTNGTRLLVVSSDHAALFDASGHRLARLRASVLGAALSPNGRELALLAKGAVDRVEIVSASSPNSAPKPVFSGAGLRQLAWSPNGRWLLVTWPAADQWVFVRVFGGPRIAAVSHIDEQFGARGSSQHAFPWLDGWCCQR